MLQKLKIPIIIVVTAILTQLAGYAVHAAMPDALLPAGTTRYATIYGVSPLSITGADGWVDMSGMTKYISIPSGKTADVIVIFCGWTGSTTGQLIHVRALIRDAAASPSAFHMSSLNSVGTSSCAIFEKSNVTAGNPPVKIQWAVDGGIGDGAGMYTRQMLVVVNIH